MDIDHLVRSLAILFEVSGAGCLLWMALGPVGLRLRITELLLLANLSALGVVTLWSAALRHQSALMSGMTLIVLLLALLRKVSRDMHRGPHFMEEVGLGGDVAGAA